MKKSNLTKDLFAALLLASPMAGAAPQYPADFEPVILYQDTDYIAKHSAKSSQATTPPASTEQAKSDAANIAKPSQVTTPPASTEQATATPNANATGTKEESLMENYPVFLIVLALAGFVFWSNRPKSKGQKIQNNSTELSRKTSGETGVSRYLNNLPARVTAAETGVAKYLKDQDTSAN